jgi:hypothetical protein
VANASGLFDTLDAFEWRDDATFAVVIEVPRAAKADQLTAIERSNIVDAPTLTARSHGIVHAQPIRPLHFLHRLEGRRDAETAAHSAALRENSGNYFRSPNGVFLWGKPDASGRISVAGAAS